MSLAVHLYLPQMRMTHAAIVARARTAEAAGFEGIAFMDHLAPPLAADQDMWEAMSTAAWVLARTTTLTVGHLVLCDALRHPALLAQQVTSLDHASGGRFELGIGSGSMAAELATFGVGTASGRDRSVRLAETLMLLRALWSGEPVDHDGAHFTVHGAQQRPVPTRRIPITIGGIGPRTLELVRSHADWWNVSISDLGRLDELRPLAGSARVSVQQMFALVSSEAERVEWTARIARRYGATKMHDQIVIGDAEQITAHLQDLQVRGVERCYAWFADFATVATLDRFGRIAAAAQA